MDQELKHFYRVNQNLALIVDDLKMRQEGLQKEVETQNTKLEKQEIYMKKFKDDLYECVKSIQNYKELKSSIVGLHKKYVLEEVKKDQGETDLQKEYTDKRKHLEKSVNYLRIMISKDASNHRGEYTRFMNENVTLLQEINDLKKEVIMLDQLYRKQKLKQGSTMGSRFSMKDDGSKMGKGMNISEENAKELKMQDVKIQELSEELAKLQEDNQALRERSSRGGARKLPPIEKKTRRSQRRSRSGRRNRPTRERIRKTVRRLQR
jgi:myosin heavy subunit